jgi:hypothetical protein
MNNYTGLDSPWHRLCSIYLFRKIKKEIIESNKKKAKVSEIKINDPFISNDSIYLSLDIHLCHHDDENNQLITYHYVVTSTIPNDDELEKNLLI